MLLFFRRWDTDASLFFRRWDPNLIPILQSRVRSPRAARMVLVAVLLTSTRRHLDRGLRMSAGSTGGFELEMLSPAKISLFLRILGRGDDGFHESASLFQAIDINDRLRLARIPGDEIAAAGVVRPSRKAEPIKQHVEFTVSPAGVAHMQTDERNSVVRALTLYRTKLTQRDGGSFAVPRFRAHLLKELPLDSGLGGAASNAAAALLGANRLCGGLASEDELREWAAEMGPDVVAFLGGTGSAYCTGRAVFLRGDSVVPLPPPTASEAAEIFVVAPEVAISTPALFRALGDGGYSELSDAPPQSLLDAFGDSDTFPPTLPGGGSALVNDLEAPALGHAAALAAVRTMLVEHEGFNAVALSGAGPSLFAAGRADSGEAAEAFAARFERECKETTGVRVRVWPTRVSRGPRPLSE